MKNGKATSVLVKAEGNNDYVTHTHVGVSVFVICHKKFSYSCLFVYFRLFMCNWP